MCALCISYEVITPNISPFDLGHDGVADRVSTKSPRSELRSCVICHSVTAASLHLAACVCAAASRRRWETYP